MYVCTVPPPPPPNTHTVTHTLTSYPGSSYPGLLREGRARGQFDYVCGPFSRGLMIHIPNHSQKDEMHDQTDLGLSISLMYAYMYMFRNMVFIFYSYRIERGEGESGDYAIPPLNPTVYYYCTHISQHSVRCNSSLNHYLQTITFYLSQITH